MSRTGHGADHGPDRGRRSTRRSLGAMLRGRGWQVFFLGLTSFVGGALEAAFLLLATRSAFAITDHSDSVRLFGRHSLALGAVFVLALLTAVIRTAFALAGNWQSAKLTTAVVAGTRRSLAEAFLRASWPVQQGDRTGQLQELLTTFTNQGTILLSAFTLALSSVFNLVALLAAAIAIAPLGALAVVGVGVLLSLVLRPIRAAVRKRAQATADAGMRFASSLSEISALGLEMHVFGVQDQARKRVDRLISGHSEAEAGMIFARGVVPSVYTGLAYLVLVGALAAVAASSAGNIATLGAVMLVMLRSLSYAQAVQTSTATIHSATPFVDALHAQLEKYEMGAQHEGETPVGSIAEIELRQVSYAYVEGDPVLKGISLVIHRREVVGIVGPSGGGKSTLVQLLLGLREPDSGQILIDGRDIRDMSRREWARKVTFVPQHAQLISGTIEENIRFMRTDVPHEKIVKAAELAHLDKDIEQFPGGYSREVGDHGGTISGGQQQRLCIARALVEDPDVLILDEPTSALDARSEHLVRQTLEQLRSRMTIIIIAHRLSTLNTCDRIMVIQNGELRGFDTPSSLAASNSFFSEALELSRLT